MSAAQHADRILQASQLADPGFLEAELQSAWAACNGELPASSLELEHRDLLKGVIEHIWTSGSGEIHLTLLRHLRNRSHLDTSNAPLCSVAVASA